MFQSKEYIQRKHGKTGTDRAYYLNQLVQEYKTTDKHEAKRQVLANLANFAYDPINYNSLWDLQVVDLFLEAIKDEDVALQEFGMGGLANICLEPRHLNYIMSNEEYRDNIVKCIDGKNPTNLILNSMTALMQLVTAENYSIILTAELELRLHKIRVDKRHVAANTVALVFLTDYYHYHLASSSNT